MQDICKNNEEVRLMYYLIPIKLTFVCCYECIYMYEYSYSYSKHRNMLNLIAVQNLFKFELSVKNGRLCTTLIAMPREAHTSQ